MRLQVNLNPPKQHKTNPIQKKRTKIKKLTHKKLVTNKNKEKEK